MKWKIGNCWSCSASIAVKEGEENGKCPDCNILETPSPRPPSKHLLTPEPASDTWDGRFLELARHVAQWSKDPSTKVGAVLVSEDRSTITPGYNGLPRGIRDDPEALADREYKLARVVHAEVNAILNCEHRPKGHTLYIWPMPPCSHCAAQIIQAGITRVVAPGDIAERWQESCRKGQDLLLEAGVAVDLVP